MEKREKQGRGATVTRVVVEADPVDYGHPEVAKAFADVYREAAGRPPPPGGLPLARERVFVELAGVPTAVANALRRSVTDEIPGSCLAFDPVKDFDHERTTDPFMGDEHFVLGRVRAVALRCVLPKALPRYALHRTNVSDAPCSVFAGDLVAEDGRAPALFNPLTRLAVLQPGKAIHIDNIVVASGRGRDDGNFVVGLLTTCRPLDVAERPRAETHAEGGGAAAESGYAESSLVANPRRFEVAATFPAVVAGAGDGVATFAAAAAALARRFGDVADFLGKALEEDAGDDSRATAFRTATTSYRVEADAGDARAGPRRVATLEVAGETSSVGMALVALVCDLEGGVSCANSSCVLHEKVLRVTVALAGEDAKGPGALLLRAASAAAQLFEKIEREIRAAVPETRTRPDD